MNQCFLIALRNLNVIQIIIKFFLEAKKLLPKFGDDSLFSKISQVYKVNDTEKFI